MKREKLRNLIKETYEEILNEARLELTSDLLNEIKWDEIEKKLSDIVGTKVKLSTPDIKRGYLTIESQDLSKQTGVFKSIFKDVVISGNHNNMTNDNAIWINWSFKWKYVDGGSNGSDLLSSFWSFDKNKWTYK